MTVNKIVYFFNRQGVRDLVIAGFTAFVIASIATPSADVSVAGSAMLAFIAIGFDHETRESHLARFWSSSRLARLDDPRRHLDERGVGLVEFAVPGRHSSELLDA